MRRAGYKRRAKCARNGGRARVEHARSENPFVVLRPDQLSSKALSYKFQSYLSFSIKYRGEGKVHFDVSLAFKKWFTFGFTFLTFFTFYTFFTFFIFFTFESRRDHVRIEVFTFFTSVFTFHYTLHFQKDHKYFSFRFSSFKVTQKLFFCCQLLFFN